MEKPTLREWKKQRTRETLMNIAMQLFLEKGFESTTIDEIIEKAKVSQRTFFRYFPTKEMVIFHGYEEKIAAFRNVLTMHLKKEKSFQAIRAALIDFSQDYIENSDYYLNIYNVTVANQQLLAQDVEIDLQLQHELAKALMQLTDGSPDAVFKARQVAGATFGAIRVTMEVWFEGQCKADLMVIGNQLLDVVEVMSRELLTPASA